MLLCSAWAREASRWPGNWPPPAWAVVGVEARLVGGECPYYGCVPSKMMIRAGNAVAEALRVPGLAGSVQAHPDFATVARRIRSEATDNWDDAVAAKRFTDKGGVLVRGTGRLTGPREVTVSPVRRRRAHLPRAAGGGAQPGHEPRRPARPGPGGTPFWTNREAVQARIGAGIAGSFGVAAPLPWSWRRRSPALAPR